MSRLALCAAALVALTGCRVAIRVGVDANASGAGHVVAVVTLDRDAQNFVGDLKGQLRVGDLTKAGWTVVGPKAVADGAIEVTATKKFSSPAGAALAVRELDGGKGLFSGFQLRISRSLLRSTTHFSGTVDLQKGIESFSDPALDKALGAPLGASSDEFAQRIGTALSNAIPITVGVRLAGTAKSNAPTQSGGSASWHPKLGEQVHLVATAASWNAKVIALGVVSVLAAIAAVVFAFGGRRRSGRRGVPFAATPHP